MKSVGKTFDDFLVVLRQDRRLDEAVYYHLAGDADVVRVFTAVVVPDEVNLYGRCHRPQALGYALCDGDTGPMTFDVSVELPMAFDVVEQAVEIGQLTPYNQRLAQNGRSSSYSLLAGAAAGGAGSAGGGVGGGGGGAGAGAAWGCDSALRSKLLQV